MGLLFRKRSLQRSEQGHVDQWRIQRTTSSSSASSSSMNEQIDDHRDEKQGADSSAKSGSSKFFAGSGWESSTSSNTHRHQAIIDSAYGTLDEAESSDGSAGSCSSSIKRRYKFQTSAASLTERTAVASENGSQSISLATPTAQSGLTRRSSKRRSNTGSRSRSVGNDDVFMWSRQNQLHTQRSRSSSLGRRGSLLFGADDDNTTSPRNSFISIDNEDDYHHRTSSRASPVYAQGHSFDSVESFQSIASSSYRSSPEPSEYEFDVSRLTPVRKRSKRLAKASYESIDGANETKALSRRHTLPRRRERTRRASISISIVSTPPQVDLTLSSVDAHTSSPTLADLLPSRLPLVSAAVISLSLLTSLANRVSPAPLLAASPAHLLHPGEHKFLEYVNAAMSPLVVLAVKPATALALANLGSLASLEMKSNLSISAKVALASTMWASTVYLRVVFSFVFGRALGYAHPQFFSTRAIHEVSAGVAPLLLSLSIVHAFTNRRRSTSPVSLFHCALLAANFCTPIEQGGSGFWIGFSAVLVSAIACVLLFVARTVSPRFGGPINSKSTTGRSHSSGRRRNWAVTCAGLLLIPGLAMISSNSSSIKSSPSVVDRSFSQLYPEQPHLLTILLMTAPRPGNPDFLLRTIDSWLGALPEPTSTSNATSHRLRLIVYTHFRTHRMFDLAQDHFASSPFLASKAAHYLQWHRDERSADRLDQRLHVARGLHFAATDGGSSAYVMLAEDDFPLCPDDESAVQQTWGKTWTDLQRIIVATNEAMPDVPLLDSRAMSIVPRSSLQEEATSGHCGVFVATGGSGLAIRGFIAAKLPVLLLGEDDPHGDDRDARASRGQFSVKHEDEGADTPDLVIQDCLRGRIVGCELCAPPSSLSSSRSRFPAGSARNPSGVLGDRYGKSGLVVTPRLLQHHLGYNASTLPGRKYGKEEWSCGWRQPFNGEPDVLTL